MVNSRLQGSENSVFICEPDTFLLFKLLDRESTLQNSFAKNQDCEMYRTTQKTRLRDP